MNFHFVNGDGMKEANKFVHQVIITPQKIRQLGKETILIFDELNKDVIKVVEIIYEIIIKSNTCDYCIDFSNIKEKSTKQAILHALANKCGSSGKIYHSNIFIRDHVSKKKTICDIIQVHFIFDYVCSILQGNNHTTNTSNISKIFRSSSQSTSYKIVNIQPWKSETHKGLWLHHTVKSVVPTTIARCMFIIGDEVYSKMGISIIRYFDKLPKPTQQKYNDLLFVLPLTNINSQTNTLLNENTNIQEHMFSLFDIKYTIIITNTKEQDTNNCPHDNIRVLKLVTSNNHLQHIVSNIMRKYDFHTMHKTELQLHDENTIEIVYDVISEKDEFYRILYVALIDLIKHLSHKI
jgi:hypothetical protein